MFINNVMSHGNHYNTQKKTHSNVTLSTVNNKYMFAFLFIFKNTEIAFLRSENI